MALNTCIIILTWTDWTNIDTILFMSIVFQDSNSLLLSNPVMISNITFSGVDTWYKLSTDVLLWIFLFLLKSHFGLAAQIWGYLRLPNHHYGIFFFFFQVRKIAIWNTLLQPFAVSEKWWLFSVLGTGKEASEVLLISKIIWILTCF